MDGKSKSKESPDSSVDHVGGKYHTQIVRLIMFEKRYQKIDSTIDWWNIYLIQLIRWLGQIQNQNRENMNLQSNFEVIKPT